MTFVALKLYNPLVVKWGSCWRTAGLKGICSESLQKAKFLWPVQAKCLAWALPVGWVPWGLLFTSYVHVVPRVCVVHLPVLMDGRTLKWRCTQLENSECGDWWREVDVLSKAKWDSLFPQGQVMQCSLNWCNSSSFPKEESIPSHVLPLRVVPPPFILIESDVYLTLYEANLSC